MVFKDSGIAGTQKTFAQLEKVMSQLGFVRWTWDYDFAIYDMRFDDLNKIKRTICGCGPTVSKGDWNRPMPC